MTTSKASIRVVPSHQQVEALWMLFGAEPEEIRRNRVTATVRAARENKLDFEHLLEAHRDNERVGVTWAQTLHGRNANIWPPFLQPNEPAETADLLMSELDRGLQRSGFVMAQALLPFSAADDAKCLRGNGYQHIANLLYLYCSQDRLPASMPDVSPLDFEPFQESQSARLAAVIQKTYVGSRDVPLADGLRNIDDVLDGYRSTGQFVPTRWFIVRDGTADIGCLLLTDHPGLQHWELIYMGLVPEARGKGGGKKLVLFAEWQTRQAGCDGLLVSVDGANEPALSLYLQCGFFELDRRQVWVKNLIQTSPALASQ